MDNNIHTIYSSNFTISEEELKYAFEEGMFNTQSENFEDISEDEKNEFIYEENRLNWDATKTDLSSIEIPVNSRVLVIANLGLWDGRRSAYKIAKCDNYGDILDLASYEPTFYISEDEFKCDDVHHDGTNYLTFRTISSEKAEELEYGEIDDSTESLLKLSKPIGEPIKALYGWS